MKRILITRTDRLGDVILSLPALVSIRENFPDSYIAFLARLYPSEILKDYPGLNEIIIDNEKKGDVALLTEKLKSFDFDTVVVLYPTLRIARATRKAGIPIRIATGYRYYSLLFNKRVYIHRSRIEKHEAKYNLDLLEPLGIKNPELKVKKFFISEEDEEYAKKFYKDNNLNNHKVIIMHPGSGGSALNWPLEKYAKLSKEILKKDGFKIIVSGTQSEKDIVEGILSISENNVPPLPKGTNLKQLAAIIKKADLFISGSTGPMHIAGFLGIPTISFFSPVFACGPKRWGPIGNKSSVLMPEGINCEECKEGKCLKYNCLDNISIDKVLKIAENIKI